MSTEYLKELREEYMHNIEDSRSLLREYGRPRAFTMINHAQVYLSAYPWAKDPSILTITARGEILYNPIYDYLAADGWTIELQFSSYNSTEMERPNQILLLNKKYPEYMLEILLDWSLPSSKRRKNYKKIIDYRVPNTINPSSKYAMTEGDTVKVDEITMHSPNRSSQNWNQGMVESFIKFLEENEKPSKNENAEVSIIVVSNGDYDIRSFSLDEANTSFNYPDLHYGNGFEAFHGDLMKRVDDESKGLILFHGEPGTGKTQYIRHLLKELCGANKAVLYSPPAVSASLAEPQMINFISDWIMGEKRDCILLIEDAEPLLESRNGGVDGRSTGISNLLNITDGILNDILGLMVIATFNIEISKIDPALLRPGRLIARKEFKKMDELQTENLAAALGIEKPETDLNNYPITLAEFYNNRKAKNILTHDWKTEERSKIGFSTGSNK